MLRDIPQPVFDRMRELEAMDAADRLDGTAYFGRLRQIPPDTGRLLCLLAAGTPPGRWLEVGASAGYSALWLSLACREAGRPLTTLEINPAKVAVARETFARAGVGDVVELIEGDAHDLLPRFGDVAFCFLDSEKADYLDLYELVVPSLVPGGLLVADNTTSHEGALGDFVARALSDDRGDALNIPLDRGVLVFRRECR
ncbi:MAG TPA: O-methyltransferase [Thermoleophilia bacterium]|nr:O-methyltransferase [Thermoleophilia bacterium]